LGGTTVRLGGTLGGVDAPGTAGGGPAGGGLDGGEATEAGSGASLCFRDLDFSLSMVECFLGLFVPVESFLLGFSSVALASASSRGLLITTFLSLLELLSARLRGASLPL
jgi:hypothetical protein